MGLFRVLVRPLFDVFGLINEASRRAIIIFFLETVRELFSSGIQLAFPLFKG